MFSNKPEFLPRLILCLGLMYSSSVLAQGYSIAPLPQWVTPITLPASTQVAQQNNSYGVAYLLVDQQWRIDSGRQSHYRHFADKALNTSGVAQISQLAIDFDPDYENVILHQIILHRDGQSLDRMNRSQINIIQREKDLESQIYDGAQTLNVFIEDVRSGDTVEYSYSVEGSNPVLSGHFSEQLKLRWGVPVTRLHYRLLWPTARPLHIQNHETGIEASKTRAGDFTEYVWQQNNIAELISDQDTPNWYDPFPMIYLSDIADWNQVSHWAWPMYRPILSSPAQNDITVPIMQTTSNEAQRTLAALRFVQDEVRYLGIEMGERSHRPNSPDAVIQQRFGDCKDKSRLLVSLLQGMGIPAHTALVNTYSGEWLTQTLPSPTAFNHAIVRAQVDGKNYWLDPTLSYQSGNLDKLYQPNYKYALVISEQGTDLTKMSDDTAAVHSKQVEETFDIRDAVNKPASYQISSSHERYYADSIRQSLAESNPDQVQQSYLNYLVHYYADIQVADKITFDDDTQLNKLTVTEHYSIPKIWQESDDERYIIVDFEPLLINDHVKKIESPIRTMPYAVTHPVRYQHTTRVLVPADSSFEPELIEVVDKAFKFTKKVDFADNVLVINYSYESLSDHVLPEDIQSYSNNIRQVQNLSSYQISMSNPDINLGVYSFDAKDLNWPLISVVLLTLLGAIYLSFKYIYLYDPPYQLNENIEHKLSGLGGWLILPGLALIASPIRILIESKDLWYVFSALQWSIVEDQFGPDLLILVAIELICNVALVVAAGFLVVMYFSKRHTLPRLFIIYFVSSCLVFATDLLVVHLLAYPGVEVTRTDLAELVRIVIFTAIWSLYFNQSERVKATFTRQRKQKPVAPGDKVSDTSAIVQDAA